MILHLVFHLVLMFAEKKKSNLIYSDDGRKIIIKFP